MWLHLYFKKNSTKQTCLSPTSMQNHIQRCMTYLTYFVATQHLWHSCMNMWMCVHGIKTRKHKTNPNLNIWKRKQITSMWNRILKPQIYEKWSKPKVLYVKSKTKSEKLWFPSKIMCTHEQAYICNQDYAHRGFSPETLATQKLKQSFKTINLTS